MHQISPNDLVDMSTMSSANIYRIELSYAHDDNILFSERIYKENARLYLHKTLANIVEKAALKAREHQCRLILYDGLRTTTAQKKMLETRAVKDNPHWLQEPRLLSPPGAGAHPRGMAIDVSLETLDGQLLDMGTAFDFLSSDPSPQANPAHREYNHGESIRKNRALLDSIMLGAANEENIDLMPLPQEWWDYRMQPKVYSQFVALSDNDLPEAMKMCD